MQPSHPFPGDGEPGWNLPCSCQSLLHQAKLSMRESILLLFPPWRLAPAFGLGPDHGLDRRPSAGATESLLDRQ